MRGLTIFIWSETSLKSLFSFVIDSSLLSSSHLTPSKLVSRSLYCSWSFRNLFRFCSDSFWASVRLRSWLAWSLKSMDSLISLIRLKDSSSDWTFFVNWFSIPDWFSLLLLIRKKCFETIEGKKWNILFGNQPQNISSFAFDLNNLILNEIKFALQVN